MNEKVRHGWVEEEEEEASSGVLGSRSQGNTGLPITKFSDCFQQNKYSIFFLQPPAETVDTIFSCVCSGERMPASSKARKHCCKLCMPPATNFALSELTGEG